MFVNSYVCTYWVKRNSCTGYAQCDSLLKKKPESFAQNYVLWRLVFMLTSLWNGATYQIIVPWAPGSYNRCSKRPSWQTEVHSNGFSRTGLKPLSQLLEFLPPECWKGLHNRAPLVVPTWNNQSRVRSGDREGYEIVVLSTILGKLRPNTAGHHSALVLRCAKTTTSASQLESDLQAAPVDQLSECQYIVEQSVSQVADTGPIKPCQSSWAVSW
jgi:hypothetical protein